MLMQMVILIMGKNSRSLQSQIIMQMQMIPVSKKNKKESYQEELEECMISFIASLFDGILSGSRRDRLLSKFVESEYEKIDRLMGLYTRYSDRGHCKLNIVIVIKCGAYLQMNEEERYNRKLESGLYSLQLIAVILGHLWSSEHRSLRARIELLLRQQKLSKGDVRDILQVYLNELVMSVTHVSILDSRQVFVGIVYLALYLLGSV
ncbi:hypothetical protein GIB67_007118 [Kingdonia uniflora]|uniref:Beta-catenin-like protein 1 N-terminal domain-containing protein n=1 Tax=Kingdonia uniflora TaxID=39325 RepID=A0A7J7MLC8_9MAGN|nr:hypothetical protein GIB67_007118 [Kingdonia uniflora]